MANNALDSEPPGPGDRPTATCRRRIYGKQTQEGGPVVEKHVWHCKLCEYSFSTVTRKNLFKKNLFT